MCQGHAAVQEHTLPTHPTLSAPIALLVSSPIQPALWPHVSNARLAPRAQWALLILATALLLLALEEVVLHLQWFVQHRKSCSGMGRTGAA